MEQRPVMSARYEYVGGWKLRSSYQVLNENEKLEAKDNPSDRATVSGEYKLANPTISIW